MLRKMFVFSIDSFAFVLVPDSLENDSEVVCCVIVFIL